ncbi:MAG: 60S ribosomal protein L30 [Paramarteilia canceri]
MVSKKGATDFNKQLNLCVKTGKIKVGSKKSRQDLIAGNAKIIIFSNSLHPVIKAELEYLSIMAGVNAVNFDGDCHELGLACSKKFRVNSVSISDSGMADWKTLTGEAQAQVTA